MPRKCSICTHDDREAIDAALMESVPYREIAQRHDVTPSALSRHLDGHVSPALVAIHEQREQQHGETLYDRIEELYRRASRILDAAEEDGKASVSLAAIRELRQTAELLGKLTGELDDRPVTINVLTSPEWLQVRSVMLRALATHPDARAQVAGALAELEAGS